MCAEASIAGPDDPLQATYVLAADLATWRDLLGGEDPGRIVMYRRLRLEEGDVVRFFRGIYFFVESIAVIGRVPVDLP
jgi:putative sterol carrier protein